jgi:outer membrane protein assembly factor BamA
LNAHVLRTLLAGVLWLLVVPARAEVPADLMGKPVAEVEVAGETAAIVSAREIGIPLGAPLNRALVRGAILKLVNSGRFTDVQIDALDLGDVVKLIVRLTPRIVVHRLDVAGNRSMSEQSVRDALRVTAGGTIAPEQLPELSRAVARMYAEHGYLGAQIDATLRDTDDPSQKVLIVRIEEGAPTRIRAIAFEGDQPIDPVAVQNVMRSETGDVLDRAKLVEDVRRAEAWLRGRGYLEAALGEPLVTIEGQRAAVAIPSRIGPRYEVLFSGYAPFMRSDIDEALGLANERLTPLHVKRTLAERVHDFYARRGYHDARARVWVAPGAEPGKARLFVQIVPGKQLRVVSVSFAGARHFSRDLLEDQLFSYLSEELPGSTLLAPVDSEVVDEMQHGQPRRRRREVPAPPVTDPEEFYYESAYQKAIEHIGELYREQGYLSARVGPVELVRVGEDRAAVLIPVVEGPRSRLHAVVLRGARALPPRELLARAGLSRNQPFSYVALEQARRRMLDAYHERGYAYAKVDATVRFSSDRTRTEVDLQVVEAFPVYIERIVVRGAERTSHDLVQQVMLLEPGDVYRPSVARESERELASLGVFTGVSVALEDPDLPARVKTVVVTVSERRSQYLDFGAGLSTGQGLRGGFEYGYRDLFGQAVSLSLRVQLAYQLFFVDDVFERRFEELQVQDRLERRLSLGTSIPRTPGLGRVRTSLDLVHVRDNERDFGLDQNALGLTFTHSPLQFLTLTLGGDLENNNIDLFVNEELDEYIGMADPRLRRLLRVPEGTSTLIAARTSASYDRRDSAFTPTRGYFASTSVELASTLSGARDEFDTSEEFVSRFLKGSVTVSGYVPVGFDVVLAAQVRIGRILHLTDESQTYPNRAFFLGGVDTMRGFLEDELIPQDLADNVERDPALSPNAIVRAGDSFALLRGEVRFPIYGQLRGGLFTDLGNLWADASKLDVLQLRPTAGVGLRLGTPVGPIALDWGFNLARRAALSERSNAVHFSIGLF